MASKSAGIIVYRFRKDSLELFIVHLGSPYWQNKDFGAWAFPKGEFKEGEPPFQAALREFEEETGHSISGNFIQLTSHKSSKKKTVYAWAVEGEIDETNIQSNLFELEWPPKSGKIQQFPEIDRGAWFPIEEAKKRVHQGLVPILDELQSKLTVV